MKSIAAIFLLLVVACSSPNHSPNKVPEPGFYYATVDVEVRPEGGDPYTRHFENISVTLSKTSFFGVGYVGSEVNDFTRSDIFPPYFWADGTFTGEIWLDGAEVIADWRYFLGTNGEINHSQVVYSVTNLVEDQR